MKTFSVGGFAGKAHERPRRGTWIPEIKFVMGLTFTAIRRWVKGLKIDADAAFGADWLLPNAPCGIGLQGLATNPGQLKSLPIQAIQFKDSTPEKQLLASRRESTLRVYVFWPRIWPHAHASTVHHSKHASLCYSVTASATYYTQMNCAKGSPTAIKHQGRWSAGYGRRQ